MLRERNGEKMKVTRKIEIESNKFMVGDVISFALSDGEKVKAIAVKRQDGGMLFCCINCLATEYSMNANGSNEGGYKESDLRKALNVEILSRFPAGIRALMQPMEYGDLLRIPTEMEIFGANEYGEPDDAEQWSFMKKIRNRIAFQGNNGDWEWYLLQNKRNDSASSFCIVDGSGAVAAHAASDSAGVRPVFLLQTGIK